MLANLLAWSAQVTMIVGVTAIALRALRLTDPRARLWTWHAVLATSLVLPVLQPWHLSVAVRSATVALEGASDPLGPSAPSVNWTIVTLVIIASGVVMRVGRLVLGTVRLRQLRCESTPWVPQPAWLASAKSGASASTVVHVSGDLPSAVAFGWQRPAVLAPVRLLSSPESQQRAVIAHELLHVSRRDWPVVVVEECVRAILWFHPAVWLAVNEAQLAREEAVDRLVVDANGDVARYVDALIASAEASPARTRIPVSPFIRRRQLVTRVNRLLKESRMSQSMLMKAGLTLAIVMGGTTWASTAMFPLAMTMNVQEMALRLPALSPLQEQEPIPLPPPPPEGMRAFYLDGREILEFGPIAPAAPKGVLAPPAEPRWQYRNLAPRHAQAPPVPPAPPEPPAPPARQKAAPPAPPEPPAPPARQKAVPPAPPEPPAPPPPAPRWTGKVAPPPPPPAPPAPRWIEKVLPPPPPPPPPPRIKRAGVRSLIGN